MPASVSETWQAPAGHAARVYVLALATRELYHAESLVRLEPKTFDLLALLVAERCRTLSRSELNDRLWNGEHVCAGALTQCVWCVRQALDDSPKQPRFIATAHRWGYRFIGRVEERRYRGGGGLLLLIPAAPETVPQPNSRRGALSDALSPTPLLAQSR
jgi:adenylate cyclase